MSAYATPAAGPGRCNVCGQRRAEPGSYGCTNHRKEPMPEPTVTITRPASFPGSPAEVAANRDTHQWEDDYGSLPRCARCDAKLGGFTADWPCGTEPPRVRITVPRSNWAALG